VNKVKLTTPINAEEQIPSREVINKIKRGEVLKLCFASSFSQERERIGRDLKERLAGFQVSMPPLKDVINIRKLITDEEVDRNNLFFERCAKDYRAIGEMLIFKLADKLKVTIDPASPYETFIPFFRSDEQTGNMEQWRYFFHGFHCGFSHKKTGQIVEVPLVFGLEFGDLDPYFFTRFIKSTKEYQPLPVKIYEDYADGIRIIEHMIKIGKFEKIDSNISNHLGVAVKDRKKIAISIYKPESLSAIRSPFSLWELLGFKKPLF
jgi:hypothetical protein